LIKSYSSFNSLSHSFEVAVNKRDDIEQPVSITYF